MATLTTLPVDASYERLRAEISYTRVRCEARPFTAGLVPALSALHADLSTTAASEDALVLDVERAEVLVFLADEDIDRTVTAVEKNLLVLTDGDRTADLYVHYMGDKTLSELTSPVLGEELSFVKGWVSDLEASPYPVLKALGPVLEQQISVADIAKNTHDTAVQALKSFREIGGRKALVDGINGTRMSTHGALGQIGHSNPQMNLPSDFADRFFLHEHRSRHPSVKELQQKLASVQAEVTAVQARLTEAQAEAQARAAKEADRKAKAHEKKVAAAQKKADQAAAKLAKVQATQP